MMLGHPDCIKTQLFGGDEELQRLLVKLGRVAFALYVG
jgi:hypothetical protein